MTNKKSTKKKSTKKLRKVDAALAKKDLVAPVEKPTTEEAPTLTSVGVTDVFGIDDKKLNDGIWVEIEGGEDRLHISHVENLKFLKLVEKEVKKREAASMLNNKTTSPIDRAMVTLEMVARHRLTGWDIVRDGKEVVYTEEKALEMLYLSKQLDQFVNITSIKLSNFYKDAKEEDEKK